MPIFSSEERQTHFQFSLLINENSKIRKQEISIFKITLIPGFNFHWKSARLKPVSHCRAYDCIP